MVPATEEVLVLIFVGIMDIVAGKDTMILDVVMGVDAKDIIAVYI